MASACNCSLHGLFSRHTTLDAQPLQHRTHPLLKQQIKQAPLVLPNTSLFDHQFLQGPLPSHW